MAVDVDDLLVEQIAFEQEIALVVGERRGTGGFAELHGAAGSELELGDRDQGVAVAAFGRGQLEDDTVDVSGIDGGGDSKLAHMAEGASLGVDDGGPHEGGDARPLIGMLCHGLGRVPIPTLPITPHVSPTCRRTGGRVRSVNRANADEDGTRGKMAGNLDFQEIHKHTAIIAVICG